jgi:chemotaxis protein methyltransferase CheR
LIFKAIGTSPKSPLKSIAAFLLAKCGLDFIGRNELNLQRSVKERMAAISVSNVSEYFSHLRKEEKEVDRLLSLVTTGETFFFRNLPHFSVLRTEILPELIKRKKRDGKPSLRVLCAGCSTGEEPYSIAMTLLGLVNPAKFHVQIVAGDINKKVLTAAAKGVYSQRALQVTTSDQVHRYFTARPGREKTYQLSKQVQDMVQFHHMNLAELDSHPHVQGKFDLIFCRNVIIYFDKRTTLRLLGSFQNLLDLEGTLFMGHSESLYDLYDGLFPEVINETVVYRKTAVAKKGVLNQPQIFYTKKKTLPASTAATKSIIKNQPLQSKNVPVQSPSQLKRLEHYHIALHLMSRKQIVDAEKEFQAELKINPQHAESHLGLAKLYADSGQNEKALEHGLRSVIYDDLNGETYHLMGVLYESMSLHQKAIDAYKKSTYIDVHNYMAHYHLAEIHLSQGQHAQAEKSLQTAIRCIELNDNLSKNYFDPTYAAGSIRVLSFAEFRKRSSASIGRPMRNQR